MILEDKVLGSIVGFAVGDALGFPAAGIRKKDFLKLNKKQLRAFQENKHHPFFYKLKRGDYTDNTRLFILTLRSLIKRGGFSEGDILKRLKSWAKKCQEKPIFERWPGTTSLRAGLRLLKGAPSNESGVKNTESCASTYRTIPVGIFFAYQQPHEVLLKADRCCSYTHNSVISRAGSSFCAIAIASILKGNSAEKAFMESLKMIDSYYNDKSSIEKLLNLIREAIKTYKGVAVTKARRRFGTGSLIWQTVPLSVYCILKSKNIRQGVLMAANSLREDSFEEKEKLAYFGWTQQLLYCRGGNTDGIAAITGSFLGAFYGLSAFPRTFRKVENFNKLKRVGRLIVKQQKTHRKS